MPLPKTVICDSDIGRFLLFRTMETITRSLLMSGDFEPTARRLVAALFPDGDAVVIDAGANIGTFTIPVAKANPAGVVYCFEPQRIVFYQLCANIILNSLPNVTAIHAAIGNPDSFPCEIDVPIVDYSTAQNLGAISLTKKIQSEMIKKQKYKIEKLEKVDFTAIDFYFKNRKAKVDFIKIDVEGMELQALTGASELLTQDQPVIFFESWIHATEERKNLQRFCEEHNYSTYFLQNDALAIPRKPLRSGKVITILGNTVNIA
jgi:FkbM family methyltransferase